MRRAQAGLALAILSLLLGSPWALSNPNPPTPSPWAPVVLGDGDVAAALTASAQRRDEALAAAPDPAAVPATPAELKAALEQCWNLGATETAERIIARHPDVCASWDSTTPGVSHDCTLVQDYANHSWFMLVRFHRADATRPLVIAVPPGTFSAPEDLSSRVQDLAFLRARAVVFDQGEQEAAVSVPVACAKFDAGSPHAQQAYALRRFERGSDVERLMVLLCGADLKQECQAQLAVWTLRNNMTQPDLVDLLRQHSVPTFQSERTFHEGDIPGTAQLLMDAGIDPRGLKFFGGQAAASSPGNRS